MPHTELIPSPAFRIRHMQYVLHSHDDLFYVCFYKTFAKPGKKSLDFAMDLANHLK